MHTDLHGHVGTCRAGRTMEAVDNKEGRGRAAVAGNRDDVVFVMTRL